MFHAKSQRTQVVMTENEIAKIFANLKLCVLGPD